MGRTDRSRFGGDLSKSSSASDRLTAAELVGIAYGSSLFAPDIIGAQLHSWSRRGALRRLVAKGKVMIGPYRRRKVFELGERSPVGD